MESSGGCYGEQDQCSVEHVEGPLGQPVIPLVSKEEVEAGLVCPLGQAG